MLSIPAVGYVGSVQMFVLVGKRQSFLHLDASIELSRTSKPLNMGLTRPGDSACCDGPTIAGTASTLDVIKSQL